MFEMSVSCEHHGYSELVACVDRLLVAHRAARLNYGFNARFTGYLYTVGERENASDAKTAPLRLKLKLLALAIACLSASTRDVCPIPEA